MSFVTDKVHALELVAQHFTAEAFSGRFAEDFHGALVGALESLGVLHYGAQPSDPNAPAPAAADPKALADQVIASLSDKLEARIAALTNGLDQHIDERFAALLAQALHSEAAKPAPTTAPAAPTA